MNTKRPGVRHGFTIRDLAVMLTCLLVTTSLLVSVTGANRSLSKTQVCADNLRNLFAGVTSYVNQYNSYPPNVPYPQYIPRETINGVDTAGWDPNIGFIMTCGLGIQPPATDTRTGHFKWYGAPYETLPDICKCPAMSAGLLDPSSPEIPDPARDGTPLLTLLYPYALSYQTSGTCRAATRVQILPSSMSGGIGGRNPAIPDPTSNQSARQADNCEWCVPPYVWVAPKMPGNPVDDPTPVANQEIQCFIQAVQPAEVQAPSRLYYLADSRDYRPQPKGQPYDWPPAAGTHGGWYCGWGNKIFLGTRHFEYANVLYLDGRVSRANQTHVPQWNMDYSPTGEGRSSQWRAATFATDISFAGIRTQVHIMPVLMVKGWEYFFDTNGMLAR